MPYIGKQPEIGAYKKLDSITAVNGQAAYTLQHNSANYSPASANHLIVSLNGVIQAPQDSFTVSGSTLTFASNLSTGDSVDFILALGDVLDIGTPSDNTVTNDKLATAPTIISKGDGSSTDGAIQLNCSQNSHGVKIKSPPHSAGQSYTLTLPSTAPAANKALITDGSGNLSFGSAGGLVLLSRQVVSSSTASVVFDNSIITSTYDDYLFRMNDVVPVSDGAYPQWQTSGDNGSSMHSAWYSNSIFVRFDNNNSGGNSVTSNQTYMQVVNAMGTNTREKGNYQIWLNSLNNTGSKAFYGQNTQMASNGLIYTLADGFFRDADGAVDYFKFLFSTGNIASGTFTLYGLVKS